MRQFLSYSDFHSCGYWIAEGPRSLLHHTDPDGSKYFWEKSTQYVENVLPPAAGRSSWTLYRSFNGFDTWSILRECSFRGMRRDAFKSMSENAADYLVIKYWRGEGVSDLCSAVGEIASAVSPEPAHPRTDEFRLHPGRNLRVKAFWNGFDVELGFPAEGPTTSSWNTGLAELKSQFVEPVAPTDLLERFGLQPIGYVDFRQIELQRFGSELVGFIEEVS